MRNAFLRELIFFSKYIFVILNMFSNETYYYKYKLDHMYECYTFALFPIRQPNKC